MDLTGLNVGPGESIQRLKRDYTEDFTDQHGRRFAATYELSNSRPIGELSPVGFHPPWLPPMRFIVWERRSGGFRFRWDYATMAAELSGDSAEYYSRVMDFMLEHMKEQMPPEVGEPVPPMVLRSHLGKPPLSPALPLAAEAGEPWILGVAGATVNQQLKDIIEQSSTSNGRAALNMVRERMQAMAQSGPSAPVPTLAPEVDPATVTKRKTIADVSPADIPKLTYPEFLAHCMSQGMKQSAAVLAWQDHKKAMAA